MPPLRRLGGGGLGWGPLARRLPFTAALLLWAMGFPACAADHVVSLNLCTDQMLVLLAPEKIAALSPLSRDPALSVVAPQAAHLPVVQASAEAVLRLHPDLILAAPFGAQATLALLAQEGLPVLRIDLPADFTGIRQQTRALANALGVPERGEALLAAMDATLAALPHRDHAPHAVAWEPRGYTAGPGSLMDAVMRAAGLINASDGGHMGLEALLAASTGPADRAGHTGIPLPGDGIAGPSGTGRPAPPRDTARTDHLRRTVHCPGRGDAGAMIRRLALLLALLFAASLLIGDGIVALPHGDHPGPGAAAPHAAGAYWWAAVSVCRVRCCRGPCAIRSPIPGCSGSPAPPGSAR